MAGRFTTLKSEEAKNPSGVWRWAKRLVDDLNKESVVTTRTVATLPAATTVPKGTEYYITDASANTRLSTVAGGGANFVKVFSDGSNWLIQ